MLVLPDLHPLERRQPLQCLSYLSHPAPSLCQACEPPERLLVRTTINTANLRRSAYQDVSYNARKARLTSGKDIVDMRKGT